MASLLAVAMRCALVLVCCLAAASGELLDLSHTFDNTTLYWNAEDSFTLTKVDQAPGSAVPYSTHRFEAPENGGTHINAPAHYYEGGWTTDEIPVDRLIANAAVIDISEKSATDPDAQLTAEDLDAWRDAYGEFKYPTIVLVKTGYAAYWPDRSRYFGQSAADSSAHHFPGISEEVAQELSEDPAVVGVGIDTASIDRGVSEEPAAHVILAGANRFNLENLGDMSRVPATGARIIALPMKIGGGSGGPCRVLIDLEPCRGKGRGQKGKGRGQKGKGRGQKGQGRGQRGRGQRGQGRRQGRRQQQAQAEDPVAPDYV